LVSYSSISVCTLSTIALLYINYFKWVCYLSNKTLFCCSIISISFLCLSAYSLYLYASLTSYSYSTFTNFLSFFKFFIAFSFITIFLCCLSIILLYYSMISLKFMSQSHDTNVLSLFPICEFMEVCGVLLLFVSLHLFMELRIVLISSI